MNGKKISIPRLLITLFVLAGAIFFAFRTISGVRTSIEIKGYRHWFAPYIDVTSTPRFSFEQKENILDAKNIVLAFIVSSPQDPCEPYWGGYYSLDEASNKLDLDRRIARYRGYEGNVSVSFGGQLNRELAVLCTDEKKLKNAYSMVIDRYKLDTIDLDLEGEDLGNVESLKRRFKVLAALQKEIKSSNKSLAIWLTLPASTQGLSEAGTTAVSEALSAGIDLAGVNVMTMDFGESRPKNMSMSEAINSSLKQSFRQVGILYSKSGTNLSDSSIWSKIGITIMIGQNDVQGERFNLEDASKIHDIVHPLGVGRVSIWSLNRDIECGENYVNTEVVSNSCSGIKQQKFDFSKMLQVGFDGKISDNSSHVTVSDKKNVEIVDDPENSPYQIWNIDNVYLEGSKVVWHKNVYQAKWWTKGDLPDNPVLQVWQTPWTLVGPVLPDEKPIKQPSIPKGIFPEWSGQTVYQAGQIVLLDGVPYRAKWWTQGDSPAKSSSNPDSSSWIILNQDQVDEIISNRSKM